MHRRACGGALIRDPAAVLGVGGIPGQAPTAPTDCAARAANSSSQFGNDLDVAVHQRDHLARGGGDGSIVQRRIVERARVSDDAQARIVLQAVQIVEHGGVVGGVVHDDHFEIRVGGLAQNALDARSE